MKITETQLSALDFVKFSQNKLKRFKVEDFIDFYVSKDQQSKTGQ